MDVPLNDVQNSSVPLFFGWFFNGTVAESINMIGKKYFVTSYDSIPTFQRFINELSLTKNISSPLEYYLKPVDPDSQLPDLSYHTTAKFCGRNDTGTNCTAYLHEVSQYIGRAYQMHLVGLFFTKSTYGVRIKLTAEEQSLFQEDNRVNSAQTVISSNVSDSDNYTTFPVKSRGFGYEPYYYGPKNDSLNRHPYYPGINFRPQKEDFHPTESRAHITMGCAPNISAVQTGLDLLNIIDLEVSSFVSHQDYAIEGTDIPKGILREYKVEDDYDSTAFVIYPSEEMIAGAVFDAYA